MKAQDFFRKTISIMVRHVAFGFALSTGALRLHRSGEGLVKKTVAFRLSDEGAPAGLRHFFFTLRVNRHNARLEWIFGVRAQSGS